MSAKKARNAAPAPERPAQAAASTLAPAGASLGSEEAGTATPMTPWIESPDPRKRRFAQIALVAVWLYVAALWLLALDQWFKWGIFGP